MFEGGWVCRACWKSNRPQDDRCYRCKTPREAQVNVEAGSLREQSQPGYQLRGRSDARYGLLATIVSVPMLISAWALVIISVLLFLYALLELLSGDQEAALGLGAIAAVFFLVSMLWRFISRSVRRNARWAYAIAAIAYLLPIAPTLLGVGEVPQEYLSLPDSYFTIQAIIGGIYVLLGLGAVFLLITSFIPQDSDERSASPESG